MNFLRNKYALVLTAVILVQGGCYYNAAFRNEAISAIIPLSQFPAFLPGWQMVQDTPVEQEVLDVLKADDTLSRFYVGTGGSSGASLFMAFFKTQRTGQSPHSPKNCLPGSGWEQMSTGFLTVDVPGTRNTSITINRYVVARGDERSVVLYWYQTPRRVIASELSAKVWLVLDSIRYHRSDTALVRVVIPVRGDAEAATRQGIAFVQAMYPAVERQFPA